MSISSRIRFQVHCSNSCGTTKTKERTVKRRITAKEYDYIKHAIVTEMRDELWDTKYLPDGSTYDLCPKCKQAEIEIYNKRVMAYEQKKKGIKTNDEKLQNPPE